jgi:hypothetical protein
LAVAVEAAHAGTQAAAAQAAIERTLSALHLDGIPPLNPRSICEQGPHIRSRWVLVALVALRMEAITAALMAAIPR